MDEFELIKAIINHPAGYDIDLFGVLQLRTTDNNTIEMHIEYHKDEEIPADVNHVGKNFDGSGYIITYSWPIENIDEAVRFFIKTRYEREIGLDFERVACSK